MVELDENYFKDTTAAPARQYLLEDERVLWRGRPKKSAYVAGKTIRNAPFAIIWGIIDISIISVIVSSSPPKSMLLFIIPFFALHMAPVWIWISSLIRSSREHKTIEYVITNLRIIELRGEQKYIANYLYIEKLSDAFLKIGFIDRLLKVGDITLKAGNKFLMLFDISNPVNFHAKLLALCHSHDSLSSDFEVKKVTCKSCGTMFDDTEDRCPSCGAPYRGK